MAATATADTVTGARRAIFHSEKFMEWQQQLSSSRTGRGWKHYDEVGVQLQMNGNKKRSREWHCRDQDVAKYSHERNEKLVTSNDVENQGMKAKKQQHPCQRSDWKRPQRNDNILPNNVQGDPAATEGGHTHGCKQQCSQGGKHLSQQELEQQTNLKQQLSNRRQLIMPMHSLDKSNAKTLKRTKEEESLPVSDSAAKRGSNRRKRISQRLIHEQPQHPPLKLPKLHLVLTKKEIQEDWVKITGHKYTGRPKKSTLVQLGLGLCTSLACPSSIRYLNNH